LTIFHVDITPDITLVVQTDGVGKIALHMPIALRSDPYNCHLLDTTGNALARLN
jgi:multiple sugar transport system ATP-binding protein